MIETLKKIASEVFDVKPDLIFTKTRKNEYVFARYAIINFLFHDYNFSYSTIYRTTGVKTETMKHAILYAFPDLMKCDKKFKNLYLEFRSKFLNSKKNNSYIVFSSLNFSNKNQTIDNIHYTNVNQTY